MPLIEIETPHQLPSNERHVSCQISTDSLDDALETIKARYDPTRLNLERVYYSRSDHRYWFILKNGKAKAA